MIRKARPHALRAGILLLLTLSSTVPAFSQCGKASWYELRGRTASGVPADPEALTAAHRTLPFGTRVVVENLANGRKTRLTIVDRGPFVRGRVIDVSRRAARELAFLRRGVTRVRVHVEGKKTPGCE
jgi:rare lipoprotein A